MAFLRPRHLLLALWLVAIVLCIQHPMAFLILFAALTGLCTWEFCTIVNIGLRINSNRFITTIAAVYFFFAIFDFIAGLTGAGVGVFIPFVITIMYLLISELYMKGFRKIENWAFSFMALFYIALPMSMLNMLAFIGVETGLAYVTVFTLSVFIFLWSSDTGAYVIGSKFGKHRLFPSISRAFPHHFPALPQTTPGRVFPYTFCVVPKKVRFVLPVIRKR